MEQKKNYTLPIVMMMFLFAMISFVTNLASPIGLIAKDQFAATDFMSQLGNFANFIAYAFMGIPAGLMLKRIGYKKTALAAIAVGFVGVGIQFLSGVAESFIVYVLGAFVAGFSMCMLNAVVNPMLNTLGGGGKKGNQLIQLGGSLNSLAGTVTPVLVGFLIGQVMNPSIKDANPALFIAMGVFAMAFIVLSLVSIPEPHMESAEKKAEKDKHSPLSFRHFVLGAFAIFVYVGVEVGIPAFILLYMTKGLGLGAAIAGSVAGTYWFLMLIGRLTGAAIAGKVSSKAMLGVASTLGVAMVAIAIFTLPDVSVDKAEVAQAVAIENVAPEVPATPAADTLAAEAPEVVEYDVAVEAEPVQVDSCTTGVVAGEILVEEVPAAELAGMVNMPVFKSVDGKLSFGTEMVPFGLLLLVLCGLCTSVMWGGIFNLAVEGLGKYVPMASGIFMVLVCGGGILPMIQGAVADHWGYVASYWVILCGFAYMLYYALIGSKNVNKDIPTE